MPVSSTRQFSVESFDGFDRKVKSYENVRTWGHSPRKDGVLVLQNNAHYRSFEKVTRWESFNLNGFLDLPAGVLGPLEVIPGYTDMQHSASNESYQRFRAKLYRGNAALGVTLGSYKQSREMVVDRFKTLTARADNWERVFGGKITPKKLAGFHLEVIFGWTPLLADIHASCKTVIQLAEPSVTVASKVSRSNPRFYYRPGNPLSSRWIYEGSYTYSYAFSAQVIVKNPNLWLAERAGLLNPAAVAWDLVPWSFVVNMFVNTGQLVNSISDFTGLQLLNMASTERCNYAYECTNFTPTATGRISVLNGRTAGVGRPKSRTLLTTPPKISLEFRVPDANWGSASMAASLFLQKFSKISRLLNNRRTYTE